LLQATSSAFDLPHPTLQQFLHLQGPKPLVYQGPFYKDPGPFVVPPTVVAYPDGLDIGPLPVAASSTLSLDPDTTNLNTSSGSITFFLQEDVVDPMAADEEQTMATTPLRDDLTAFNTAVDNDQKPP
jgi:hypothetical protein